MYTKDTFGSASVLAAAAGYYQLLNAPEEWGQGTAGFGWRFGNPMAGSALRHEDTRYRPTRGSGFAANGWRPDRLSNARAALERSGCNLAADIGTNAFHEFWPDVKRKLFKRRWPAERFSSRRFGATFLAGGVRMGPGFKTQLELTDAEWELILELLERERHNLPHEIHHSRTTAMREDLQRRMDLAEKLIARLEQRGR